MSEPTRWIVSDDVPEELKELLGEASAPGSLPVATRRRVGIRVAGMVPVTVTVLGMSLKAVAATFAASVVRLTERTAARLRARHLAAGTVQVKIRRSDFTTATRQRAMNPPTNDTGLLYAIACGLLKSWLQETPGARVRLLGVGGSSLVAAAQADLFSNDGSERGPSIDRTVDAIQDRFGNLAVGRARSLGPRQIR
jgi:DNA polymerase-4